MNKLRSVVIVTILAWTALCISIYPFLQADLYWQIRAGEDIARTGHAPHVDTYSWARRGTPWVVPEWLTFLLYWEVYRHCGGLTGLVALRALFNVATILCAFVCVRRLSCSHVVGLLATVVVVYASVDFFQTRPYQITSLFLILTLYIVVSVRQRRMDPRRLFLIAPLCAAWANLHQGFVIAVGLLAVYALCDWITLAWHASTERRQIAVLFTQTAIVSALASLISPYGFGAYSMIVATMTSPISRFIVEWMPLRFTPSFQCAAVAILAVWAVCAHLPPRRDLAGGVVVVVFAQQALQHQRSIPLFAIAAAIISAPGTAKGISMLLTRLRRYERTIRLSVTVFALIIAGAMLLTWTRSAAWTLGTYRRMGPNLLATIGDIGNRLDAFPEDACRYIADHRFPTTIQMFNDMGAGDYIIWRLPQYRVFVDGRNDVYFGNVLNDYVSGIYSRQIDTFFRVMSGYPIDCAITSDPFIKSAFLSRPDWVQVYAGDGEPGDACIFLKKTRDLLPLIARCRGR